jgi:hypothetical protein
MTLRDYIAGLVVTTLCGLVIYGVAALGDFRYMAVGTSALDVVLIYYFGKGLINRWRNKDGNV